MGRGLGKLLAQKGANVVIVARNQKKLDEALVYIQVRILLCAHDKYPILTKLTGCGKRHPTSKVPCH